MKYRHFGFALTNLCAVIVLAVLIASPFYFAGNFTKVANVEDPEHSRRVAGAKSQMPYIVVSHTDQFPDMNLNQSEGKFMLDFVKINPSQAYIGVLTLENPNNNPQTYSIEPISGYTKVFFGENVTERASTTTVPSMGSVPISIFSESETAALGESVEFKVLVK
ncbi:MAG: hypothetical protein WD988_03895 [Candidatus Curtissbacteria bacterium]